MRFISKSDSLEKYYTSDEYYRKRDSAFNKINFWSLLVGAGHRNRAKGNEFFIQGLLGQINFLGIDLTADNSLIKEEKKLVKAFLKANTTPTKKADAPVRKNSIVINW